MARGPLMRPVRALHIVDDLRGWGSRGLRRRLSAANGAGGSARQKGHYRSKGSEGQRSQTAHGPAEKTAAAANLATAATAKSNRWDARLTDRVTEEGRKFGWGHFCLSSQFFFFMTFQHRLPHFARAGWYSPMEACSEHAAVMMAEPIASHAEKNVCSGVACR